MFKKNPFTKALAAAATFTLLASGCAATGADKAEQAAGGVDYTKMSSEDLAEYLIFEAGGFDLDQPTQEGTTARERITQDETHKACSKLKGGTVDSATAAKVGAMARESIVYPEGGIKLGDWKKGRALAWSGFGYRVGHRNDDHSKQEPGGNCYNCHQIATDRTGGTIGPALTGYGKLRGTSEPILKYTYDVIYNAHSVFPCTKMPRMGANGMLTQTQIADIMAYLLDPESPVNGASAPKDAEGAEGGD